MDATKEKLVAPLVIATLKNGKILSNGTYAQNMAEIETSVLRMFTSADEVNLSLESFPESLNVSVDTASIDLEKQEAYKTKPSLYSWIRWTALNTYRRLFSIVFAANLAAFVVVWTSHRSLLNFVNGAAANLLVCGLARQPLVVNSFFIIACKIPRTAPLRLRTLAAKVFHFGGVHSGCGVATSVWYISFVGLLTYQYMRETIPHSAGNIIVIVLAYLIMILLCGIIVVAHPMFRSKFHNCFESIHRFSGWAAIVMFWPLLLVFSSQQAPSMGIFLIQQPTFWILIVLTAAIIQPWAMLKRVRVTPEELSTHAIRLHFDFTTTKFGQGISISRHPLLDWHSFASFPDKFDSPETKFSLVVSRAGDFTGDIIANPPTHVWKRSVPAYGFGKVMGLYQRIIVVTTGSGIGPCLSFLGDDDRPKMRVLWQTRTPEKTYGQRVIDLVHRMDPNPMILDTTKGGKRTDMLPFVIKLYEEFNAEAVCVISNPKTTKNLVFELERRGIIAMGPIFDS